MKKSLLILLILAGCGSKDTDEAAEDAPAGNLAQAAAPQSPDPAQLQAIVDRAMPLAIPDAAKARYRGIRAGAGGTVCGEVSTPAKGAPGPFRPFLVTQSGVALVSERPAIDFADPDDALADGWIKWCATAEELQALGPTLQAAAAGAAAATPSEVSALEIPTIDAIPILPPSAQPTNAAQPAEAPAPKLKTAETPPPPRIDSFFNSVAREKD
jgi:hypothetical protein